MWQEYVYNLYQNRGGGGFFKTQKLENFCFLIFVSTELSKMLIWHYINNIIYRSFHPSGLFFSRKTAYKKNKIMHFVCLQPQSLIMLLNRSFFIILNTCGFWCWCFTYIKWVLWPIKFFLWLLQFLWVNYQTFFKIICR